MKKLFMALIGVFALFCGTSANDEFMLECANSYKNVLKTNKIPSQEIVRASHAIIIIPSFYKGGFFIGGAGGKGIMIEKNGTNWHPSGVNIGGLSVGLQIGFENNILVIYILNSQIVKQIKNSKFTLNAELVASFWDKSRALNKMSEITFSDSIYAYTNNKGLFAGASLGGAVISANQEKFSNISYGFSELIHALGN